MRRDTLKHETTRLDRNWTSDGCFGVGCIKEDQDYTRSCGMVSNREGQGAMSGLIACRTFLTRAALGGWTFRIHDF